MKYLMRNMSVIGVFMAFFSLIFLTNSYNLSVGFLLVFLMIAYADVALRFDKAG